MKIYLIDHTNAWKKTIVKMCHKYGLDQPIISTDPNKPPTHEGSDLFIIHPSNPVKYIKWVSDGTLMGHVVFVHSQGGETKLDLTDINPEYKNKIYTCSLRPTSFEIDKQINIIFKSIQNGDPQYELFNNKIHIQSLLAYYLLLILEKNVSEELRNDAYMEYENAAIAIGLNKKRLNDKTEINDIRNLVEQLYNWT